MPGQTITSSTANAGTTPSTGQRILSAQVEQCANNVASLILVTQQQKTQAQLAGDVATADALNTTAIELSVQYGDLARHQLKTIDDSALMKQAIQGFVTVNSDIKAASTMVQSATAFADTVTTIANTLDTLITSALITA